MTRATWSCALLLLLAAPLAAQERVDLLVHDAKVFSADDRGTMYRAVAMRDGKIVAVGGEELVARYRAERTVDAHGKLVIPGFMDTHIHVRGVPRRAVSLAGAKSLAEIQERIRRKARELGAGEWVTAYDWSEDELAEKRRPLRADLDAAAPENPVLATRAGGHSGVASSLALKLAGITRETPDPEGGIIEHDSAGEPNGVLRERAQGLAGRLVPRATPDETRESFVAALRDLLRLGITSMIEAGTPPSFFPEWERVYREHGDELPRVAAQVRVWPDEVGADSAIALIRNFGRKTGDGDERLRVGPLKIGVDGGFTGAAAWTLEPYKGQPGFYGKALVPKADLLKVVRAAHALGWQMGFHTIGDAAIQMTVDVYDQVLRESPRPDHRNYLNHFTVKPPEATLRKMVADHIGISQQPNFTYTLDGRYRANLEGPRYRSNNPLRTPLSRGIFMAFGSDDLPIGPMVGLYAAVTRKGMLGDVVGPEEKLTMPEAIRAYTRSGPFLTREERIKGTIEPGKLADLIVLSEDLLTIDPERILGVKVEMTVLGGKVVYERADAATSDGTPGGAGQDSHQR